MNTFFQYDQEYNKELHERIADAAKGALIELRTIELHKLTGDKLKAQTIMELMPETKVEYDAVKDALMRGLDTEYVISILKKHNLNG